MKKMKNIRTKNAFTPSWNQRKSKSTDPSQSQWLVFTGQTQVVWVGSIRVNGQLGDVVLTRWHCWRGELCGWRGFHDGACAQKTIWESRICGGAWEIFQRQLRCVEAHGKASSDRISGFSLREAERYSMIKRLKTWRWDSNGNSVGAVVRSPNLWVGSVTVVDLCWAHGEPLCSVEIVV